MEDWCLIGTKMPHRMLQVLLILIMLVILTEGGDFSVYLHYVYICYLMESTASVYYNSLNKEAEYVAATENMKEAT